VLKIVSWNGTHQISYGFALLSLPYPAFLNSNEEAKGFSGEHTGNGNI